MADVHATQSSEHWLREPLTEYHLSCAHMPMHHKDLFDINITQSLVSDFEVHLIWEYILIDY